MPRWTDADVRRAIGTAKTPRMVATVHPGFPCEEPVVLVLPYPPLNNVYYRHVGHRVLLSQEGRRYRQLVAQIVQAEWPRHVRRPFNTFLDVTMILHPPSNRHNPDADAFEKAPMDALQHAGVYLNDKLVKDIHGLKRHPRPPFGCLEVWLHPWKDDGR